MSPGAGVGRTVLSIQNALSLDFYYYFKCPVIYTTRSYFNWYTYLDITLVGMLVLQSSPFLSQLQRNEKPCYSHTLPAVVVWLTTGPRFLKRQPTQQKNYINTYVQTHIIGDLYKKNAKGLINTSTVFNYQIDKKYLLCYIVKFFWRAIYSVLLRIQENDPSWHCSYKVLQIFGR